MRREFLARARSGAPILGDGAWGSLLIDRGLPAGQPPELWTLEYPDVVRRIAEEYLAAGAEVLTTNTFGASPIRLALHGLERRTEEINARAVDLALLVAADRAWVSGSIGPSGRLLAPLGDLQQRTAHASFARQARALAAAGVHLICIETMTDLAEAVLAIDAAKEAAPHIPVIATMTFDLTPRGALTIMGVSVAEAVRALPHAGAEIIGANCGRGVDEMIAVAAAFAACARVPIALRPNAGLPVRQGRRLVYTQTPEDFAAAAAKLLQPQVVLLGGCCGTTPAHIRALGPQVLGPESAPKRQTT